MNSYRQTTQELAPLRWRPPQPGRYDLYPAFPLSRGDITAGFDALAARLPRSGCVVCDGYVGIFWDSFRAGLDQALRHTGREVKWVDVAQAFKPESELNRLVASCLGGDDPIFGRRFEGELADLFDRDALARLAPRANHHLTILYGCGAALTVRDAFLVYLDLPKNELQFRARAGSVTNLGVRQPAPPKAMYKRFYFVDWPVLNRHKKSLADRVHLMVDLQRPDVPVLLDGEAWRQALHEMALNCLRVRPWFEPGPWGGQWCKRHLPDLPEAPNYAWSFELIVPENGLMLRQDDRLLEFSFDWLMHRHASAVLGEAGARFGDEFPIRFDFLDTVEGGNLSLQVHPRPDYIREHFGESFTQDESYYILDATPEATVNLGFQEGVDPAGFRRALETSFHDATPLAVDRYVQTFPARRHDLFLIPHGTIHGAGMGNLVLEISATPYIFTFKLYDWLRPDLDGKPRPLNIDRGMANLDFSRAGSRVPAEFISQPRVLGQGKDWMLEHLPTHPAHFYEVYRYTFAGTMEVRTEGSVHCLSLVEGSHLVLETAHGRHQPVNFAETWVVPAAAGGYHLRNLGAAPARVVMARLKNQDSSHEQRPPEEKVL